MQEHVGLTITEQDLKFITADEFETIMDIAKHNSYCSKCYKAKRAIEMVDYTISLNHLNDVVFRGKCKTCQKPIVRVIEIGERMEFLLRTEMIRANKDNEN